MLRVLSITIVVVFGLTSGAFADGGKKPQRHPVAAPSPVDTGISPNNVGTIGTARPNQNNGEFEGVMFRGAPSAASGIDAPALPPQQQPPHNPFVGENG